MPNGPFAYAEGYRARVPADVAGPALLELAGDRGLEGLPASEVVASARPEQSPLHDVFEWDDATAAEEYRLEQARGLVRSVCVVVTGDDGVETRHHLFVNLRDGEGYRRVIEVRRDAPSYERLVDLAGVAQEHLPGGQGPPFGDRIHSDGFRRVISEQAGVEGIPGDVLVHVPADRLQRFEQFGVEHAKPLKLRADSTRQELFSNDFSTPL